VIQGRRASPAGTLSPAQTLSSPEGWGDATESQVAVDRDGDATFTWIDDGATIAAQHRTAAGLLGPIERVSG
jgi:hypothetical protein